MHDDNTAVMEPGTEAETTADTFDAPAEPTDPVETTPAEASALMKKARPKPGGKGKVKPAAKKAATVKTDAPPAVKVKVKAVSKEPVDKSSTVKVVAPDASKGKADLTPVQVKILKTVLKSADGYVTRASVRKTCNIKTGVRANLGHTDPAASRPGSLVGRGLMKIVIKEELGKAVGFALTAAGRRAAEKVSK